MTLGILVAIVACFGVVALAYLQHLRSRRRERRRSEQFSPVAEQLGFEFAADGNAYFSSRNRHWHLFLMDGHAKRVRNLLLGKWHDLDVAVFEYDFVTGRGRSPDHWSYSVARIKFNGLRLPNFAVHPGNTGAETSRLGYHDVALEGQREFSDRYWLCGLDGDEGAIRSLFTARTCEYYLRQVALHTEGSRDELLVYRFGTLEPQAVRSLVEMGCEVLSLYRRDR